MKFFCTSAICGLIYGALIVLILVFAQRNIMASGDAVLSILFLSFWLRLEARWDIQKTLAEIDEKYRLK